VRLALTCELKRESIPPAVDRFPTAGGWAKTPPPLIRMAARCAHAGPTSRRTRQSRLPDRKAARRRRGLDGRRAVVTRITAALMLAFIRLYCGPCHDLSLAWHLQCVGCDKNILWYSIGRSLGLVVTCWSSLVLLGKTIHRRDLTEEVRAAESILRAGTANF